MGKSKSNKRFYLWLGIITALSALLVFLGVKYAWSSLRPIVVGIAIAYLFKSMCNVYYRLFYRLFHKSKRSTPAKAKKRAHVLSMILTYVTWLIIVVILLAAILPTLFDSVAVFVKNVPEFVRKAFDMAEKFVGENEFFRNVFGDSLAELGESVYDTVSAWLQKYDTWKKLFSEYSDEMQKFLTGTIGVLVNTATVIFNLLVGVIISAYLLSGRKKFCAQAKLLVRSIFGRKFAEIIFEEAKFADKMFSGYFVGTLIDSALIGIATYVCCLIFRIPYAILVAVIVGVGNVVPFFGPYIGMIPSFIIVLSVSPWKALGVVVLIWALQQIDGNIVAPRIISGNTGLSPFWVLFAILLFGGLFGLAGMIIAVPVFAVIADVCGKLLRYCLKQRGDTEAITDYETEYPAFLEESSAKNFVLRTPEKIEKLKKILSEDVEEEETPATTAEHNPEPSISEKSQSSE